MKNNLRKAFAAFAFAMIEAIGFTGTEVKAGGGFGVTNKFKETVTLTKDNKGYGVAFDLVDVSNGSYKNIKVTSSKKSVATIEKGGLNEEIIVYPKKAGTTKITWTATDEKTNKEVKQTGTIKVVKFENPFSTLKIADKNYASKVKKDLSVISTKTGKTKLKLKYKLKKNWKLDKNGSYFSTYDTSTGKSKIQSIKTGKTYTIKKNSWTSFQITLKNTKTGASACFTILLNQ
ncbi:MAG: hypothetical protein Q4B70_18700 [Lachnospiraceae bacterium]|nr:hypothetical protein [Lachnospiraceae bacterium]